ncbi:zinc finger BED domain-containing protein RICESLEEPER 2-like [Arachis stenosperma]|uniref:zinc finger BED domain-containing protein RICESLEEPER 2-like n=1 Tax=Arachis stenosperma TaxID=217475 RepID=UPI0025ABABC8|nr:zinc finger BED domain-containing protein RICESLEEPER 2-like [Arachis stenosperma]
MSETSEKSGSNEPVSPDTAAELSSSTIWDHFTALQGTENKAKCDYCGCVVKYEDETSAMRSHLNRCDANTSIDGNKIQKTISSMSDSEEEGYEDGLGSSEDTFKFDQEASQRALTKMFVIDELPFYLVKSERFKKFLRSIQPLFEIPSHVALIQDVVTLYREEIIKLKEYFSIHSQRVCLITEPWTSSHGLNFMKVTAQFIDNDWRLQKKVLNFCQITGYSEDEMNECIEVCLGNWKLNEVFSLTGDIASSDDPGTQDLEKRISSWDSIFLKGGYIHVQCCVHIVSLIVKEALKEIHDSIVRIRGAAMYIRSSPSRTVRFRKCVEHEKIHYKGLIQLDVETEWNSTYIMLEGAVNYQKAFVLYKQRDLNYVDELSSESGKGIPSEDDWKSAQSMLPVLKFFYDCILRIFGTSCITSDIYMKEIFAIGRKIHHYHEHDDASISRMASRMKNIYDKYWGNSNAINMLLIAVVLDPRLKLGYVNWNLDYLFGSEKGSELKTKLLSCLGSLYRYYQVTHKGSQDDQQHAQIDEDDDLYGMRLYLQSTGNKSHVRSELDRYLEEECEPLNKQAEFDLLNWWKSKSSQFPILGSMAQEVLAIPISAVTSEFAFSAKGRVIDLYRSCLPPKFLEMLVCTKSWLEGPSSLSAEMIFLEDDNEDDEIFSEDDNEDYNDDS